MISCTSWVPRGVADPNPRRFEFSQPELDMMRELEMERKSRSKKGEREEIDKSDGDESDGDGDGDGDGRGDGDGGDAGETGGATTMKGDNGQNGDLPKELRMDEYSSSSDDDDDDDDEGGGATAAAKKVGNLLVGLNESEMMAGRCSDEDEEDEEDEDEVDDGGGSDEGNGEDGDDSNDDSDDDDDLDDVEDGREYLPVDVGGMQAMGLGIDETLNFVGGDDDEDDDDSDVEDTNLMADDALLLVAKTDEDFSSLEVHVYEQNSGNLFVHHDIPLPSYPLCLAHGDINHRGEAGNFCAVGMFTPGIEIWNLDVLDALEPACVLGGSGDGDYGTTLPVPAGTGRKGGKKKKKKAGSGLREGSHTDAVMALSWNAVHRHVLASGSADRTVKVWDVTRAGDGAATPAATFRHHTDKVQGVAWHPTEGTILATGSFDRTVAIVDARCRDGGGDSPVGKGRLPADCEAIAWDPHRTQCLSAASEDGTVTCWDIRKFGGNGGAGGGRSGGRGGGDDTALWSFVAHEFGGVSDLSYNGHVPGLMATCAIDKTVALWDAHHLSTSETECRGRGRSSSSSSPSPHPCGSKDMGVGKLYSVSFYPSAPWLLGCGGGGNQPALWDLEGVEAIQKRFGERTTGDAKEKEESSVVDFDEIMTGTGGKNANDDDAGVVAAERVREKMEKKTKKKDGGKRRKKKAHRVRRD